MHAEPHYIQVGDPVLEVSLRLPSGALVTFTRCQTCEGPPPPDLPAVVVRHSPAAVATMRQLAEETFTRIHRRHVLETIPLLADREPGEEG
jgi:hypothetical protein